MRKETTITIDDNGKSLKFRIRQMPATKLYDFMARGLIILSGSGFAMQNDLDVEGAGRFIQENGLYALRGIEYDKARPLLEELLGCCTRITDTGVEQRCTFDILDGFVDDVRTIFTLQAEAVKLNFDFFGQGAASPSASPETLNIGRPPVQKGS